MTTSIQYFNIFVLKIIFVISTKNKKIHASILRQDFDKKNLTCWTIIWNILGVFAINFMDLGKVFSWKSIFFKWDWKTPVSIKIKNEPIFFS